MPVMLPVDPIVRRLLIAGIACWTLAGALVALALAGAMDGVDDRITANALALASAGGWFNGVMRGLTALGDWQVRLPIAGLFFGYLAWRRFGRAASYILYTTLGMWALNALVFKPLIARARPESAGVLVGVAPTYAMPSGHAANAAAVFGAIALVASVIWWRRGQRRAIWSAAALAILGVGMSRVWLGVHWASDVAAGWLVGTGFACLMAVAIRPVRARRS